MVELGDTRNVGGFWDKKRDTGVTVGFGKLVGEDALRVLGGVLGVQRQGGGSIVGELAWASTWRVLCLFMRHGRDRNEQA